MGSGKCTRWARSAHRAAVAEATDWVQFIEARARNGEPTSNWASTRPNVLVIPTVLLHARGGGQGNRVGRRGRSRKGRSEQDHLTRPGERDVSRAEEGEGGGCNPAPGVPLCCTVAQHTPPVHRRPPLHTRTRTCCLVPNCQLVATCGDWIQHHNPGTMLTIFKQLCCAV